MADSIREDLKEFRSEIKERLDALQEAVGGLGEKLSKHALEDADREGKVAVDLSTMRSKLETLSASSQDQQRFLRGWISGLLAVAIAATVGFLFRSAIDSQLARPAPGAPVAK